MLTVLTVSLLTENNTLFVQKSIKYYGQVAEWSKALVLGTSSKEREFESHLDHFYINVSKTNKKMNYKYINKQRLSWLIV